VCEPHLALAIEVGVVPREVTPALVTLARLSDAYAVEPLPHTDAAIDTHVPIRNP